MLVVMLRQVCKFSFDFLILLELASTLDRWLVAIPVVDEVDRFVVAHLKVKM